MGSRASKESAGRDGSAFCLLGWMRRMAKAAACCLREGGYLTAPGAPPVVGSAPGSFSFSFAPVPGRRSTPRRRRRRRRSARTALVLVPNVSAPAGRRFCQRLPNGKNVAILGLCAPLSGSSPCYRGNPQAYSLLLGGLSAICSPPARPLPPHPPHAPHELALVHDECDAVSVTTVVRNAKRA